jgi:hypothetical protein
MSINDALRQLLLQENGEPWTMFPIPSLAYKGLCVRLLGAADMRVSSIYVRRLMFPSRLLRVPEQRDLDFWEFHRALMLNVTFLRERGFLRILVPCLQYSLVRYDPDQVKDKLRPFFAALTNYTIEDISNKTDISLLFDTDPPVITGNVYKDLLNADFISDMGFDYTFTDADIVAIDGYMQSISGNLEDFESSDTRFEQFDVFLERFTNICELVKTEADLVLGIRFLESIFNNQYSLVPLPNPVLVEPVQIIMQPNPPGGMNVEAEVPRAPAPAPRAARRPRANQAGGARANRNVVAPANDLIRPRVPLTYFSANDIPNVNDEAILQDIYDPQGGVRMAMQRIADEFFQQVQWQLTTVRPYPYYSSAASTTLEKLDKIAAAMVEFLKAPVNVVAPANGAQAQVPPDLGQIFARLEAADLKCTPVEFISWVDTFMNLYPQDLSELRSVASEMLANPNIATPELRNAAGRWHNIYNAYRDLTAPPSDVLQRHVNLTVSADVFADHLTGLYNNMPEGVGNEERLDVVYAQLEMILNNPRYLAYLRNKSVDRVNGIWSIANVRLQQDQLENIYEKITKVDDFVNEPRVLEMRKRISELYGIKKRVSQGKLITENQFIVPTLAANAEFPKIKYKGVDYDYQMYFYVDFSKLHSLYITFPGYSYAKSRLPNIQPYIVFTLELHGSMGPPPVNGERDWVTLSKVELYRISKINELTGVALRQKAYIYWVSQALKVLFYGANNSLASTSRDTNKPVAIGADMSGPDPGIAYTHRVVVVAYVFGYAPGTVINARSYEFQLSSFIEYPFLKGLNPFNANYIPVPNQRYVRLLDMISKENYKLDKYRQKVARRQKYAASNMNTKMLNTVYNRYGDHNTGYRNK